MTLIEITPELRAKRVAIAKDIIAQLELKKFNPRQGAVLELKIDPSIFSEETEGQFEEISLQKVIHNNLISECSVCMRGSIILSRANLYNEINLRMFNSRRFRPKEVYYSYSPDITFEAEKVPEFSVKELAAMEVIFEYRKVAWSSKYLSEEEVQKCYQFSDGVGFSKDRMIKICNCIIDNDGSFII